MDDDGIINIYTDELIRLSETAREPRRLAKADLRARAVSPICGSEVSVEVALKDGKIGELGFDVEACALTRAVVAVLYDAARGKTREDVAKAGALMQAMLAGAEEKPAGEWEKLKLLEPVKDYPSRHNAILLPFEAVEKAFLKK